MTLLARLQDEVKGAMRARDKERLATLRLIMAEIKRIEVDERIEMRDDRVIGVLTKMVKQRRDSVTQYRDGGREDLAKKEEAEIELIEAFLPAQLSSEELDAAVSAAIKASSAESMRDMGKVMGHLQDSLAGQADMAAVATIVKAKLA
tara:strand:+ start:1967 stop:2410 length:444 start_codon:yes stop_codon:yes gene_type:complete